MPEEESYKKRADELEIGDVIIIHGVDIVPRLSFPFLKATIWGKEIKKGKLYLLLITENQVYIKTKPLVGDELFEFPPVGAE